ncbi:YggT family protein [Dermabacteraceae bacterium TAE3-ERU27]|nr:YggT family protein [Dermabacteraceae bacterium TAE3-ERU27]
MPYALVAVCYIAALLFTMSVIARLVIDWIRSFSPSFAPTGPALVFCELIFTVTDPAVLFLRRVIPPLRIGGVALDLSILVLLLACSLGMGLLRGFLISLT